MIDTAPVDIFALSDLTTPWCVHVAATLRIADLLRHGAADIASLAALARCDAYALHRVLTHLAGKGLFVEPAPGRFELNEAARQLLHPAIQMSLDLTGIGGRFAHVWETLLTYVRTGRSAYHEVFGVGFWEDLDAHPDIAAQFDDLIGPVGHGTPSADFPVTPGWDALRTVVDVGGGTGALLAEILRAHPHLLGTLVDQPRTVARSGAIFHAAGVAERAAAAGQSFFDPLPAGADLYVLKGVLNDFPDREAAALLARCAEAARPGGRVVVLGGIVPDGDPIPLTLEMVLLGGKYRTVSAFTALARGAGLEMIAAGPGPSGRFAVECVPI